MLQADDAGVRKAMEEAVGGETDAWKAAQAMEAWVFRAIQKKSMGVAFASAAEVCRDREGDCTEHAVLLAAMCRAAGIPSRVVLGLEYLTGIFGGHAWTDVWVDGTWYALDATLGFGHADPLHLALGHLALAEGTYGKEMASLAGLGNLHVDVLETTYDGRTLRMDRPDAVEVRGNEYVDRVWGISLRAPSGFEVRPRGPAEGLSPRLVDLARAPNGHAPRTLRVRVDSLGAGDDLASAVAPLSKRAKLADATIDGRPAKVGEIDRGGSRSRLALVVDDVDSIFTFALDPSAGEADERLLKEFLAGVDLDAEDPPRFDLWWDFADPAGTEAKFRALLPKAEALGDTGYLAELWTQIARTLGLRGKFEEAEAALTKAEGLLTGATAAARVRVDLERGRLLRSAKRPEEARPWFENAWERARAAGLDGLAADAGHMLAITGGGPEAQAWAERTIAFAEASKDPRARRWLAPLHHNLGWTHHDAGDHVRALAAFEKEVALRRAQGAGPALHEARWSVGRTLRALGRLDEALALQRELMQEREGAGRPDGFVFEEVAEVLHAQGKPDEAAPWFAKAHALLEPQAEAQGVAPERLERMKRLSSR
jgi:tetratricopeptide (TPR) repeat protein